MARTLANPKLSVKFTATITNDLTDGTQSMSNSPSLAFNPSLEDGIDADQANRGWHSKNRTIANGAQETIDLYDFNGLDIGAGVGRDAVGQELTLEEIMAIAIVNENDSADDGDLEVLPANSEGWTPIGSHTVAVGGAISGGGMILKFRPAATAFDVAENSHRITLRANGGDVVYSIYVMGRHDDEGSSSSSSSISTSSASSSSSSSVSSSSQSSSASSSVSSSSSNSSSSSSSSISTSSSSSSSISTSSSSPSSISTSSSSQSSASSSSSSSSSESSASSASSISTSSSSSSSSQSSESSSSASSASSSSSS